MIKIGDTLYMFNENRRIYVRDEKGRSHGGSIFAEHFEPVKVTGETKVSWIVGDPWWQRKVNKKEILSGRAGAFFTRAGMEDRIYEEENAMEIAKHVRATKAEQLRQIAKIINYEGK